MLLLICDCNGVHFIVLSFKNFSSMRLQGRVDICLVIIQDETDTQDLFSDFHFSAGAPTQLEP